MLKIDAANIIFTVINLLILFVAMRFVFFKPIKKVIEERQKEADKQFDDAAAKQEEAEGLKAQYNETLLGIEEERKQTIANARKDADAEYQRIISNAQNEARQIRETAENDAKREKEKIIKNAEKEIADMVVDAAKKVVGTQSGANIDSSLYNEFLSKAGDE
ncbi:MAG: ATP synthase F0 subunit B [Lachnospiraceae bacterium]